ncbi:MAG TPA: hypothetical protein VJ717_14840 [Gemmatimonadaceae bacterium]|nr:hypothetical protein [Gemmatimonadaceae bacterium]
MYSTCTFCYAALGANDVLETFAVSRRVAFDPKKGCLWAICRHCGGWNLAPIEERWEAVEECERRFRATSLRYSSGNIGLAWLRGELELIRVGPALRPEVAAWRYGRILSRRRSLGRMTLESVATTLVRAVYAFMASSRARQRDPRAALAQTVLAVYGNRVLDLVHLPLPASVEAGNDTPIAVVRYRHLVRATLVRPEPGRPWALSIPHDHGVLEIHGDDGVRTAARVLAVINGTERGGGFSHDLIESAVRKVDESAFPGSYFNRVLAIALRSHWGRGSDTDAGAPRRVDALEVAMSDVERLAFRLTGRTFWGHGGIGSEPSAALLDVPLVDRLALEMAAHEESERRALEGELEELEEAWREADEIATIADALK